MPKKIVYIVGGVYGVSGMNQVMTQKVNWLARNTGHELYMVLTERPDLPWALEVDPKVKWVNFGINFDELDTMPIARKLWHYGSKQRRYRRMLTEYLMKVKADIVVTGCRRDINFINDIPDGSHKVGEIHFGRSHYRQFSRKWLPQPLCRWISAKWIGGFVKEARRLERFVVLSHEDLPNWPELPNATVIHNPLKRMPDIQAACEEKRVIAVGRYTWQKGFDMLLQAWTEVQRRHPDWHLHIYGPGESKGHAALAERLGVSGTAHCHGTVDDIYTEYAASSIFVLSSRYEGFGLVLAEAMSCGLPAVSFACPCGPKDIVSHNEDGLLVENGNTVALANAICELAGDEARRKALGQKARASAQRFSEGHIMPQWTRLFDDITRQDTKKQ